MERGTERGDMHDKEAAEAFLDSVFCLVCSRAHVVFLFLFLFFFLGSFFFN